MAMDSADTLPVQKEKVQGQSDEGAQKLAQAFRKKKKFPQSTLPKGKKPSHDFRGMKDNGNGTVTYT